MKDALEYGIQKRKRQSWLKRNLIDVVGISSCVVCVLGFIIYYAVNN